MVYMYVYITLVQHVVHKVYLCDLFLGATSSSAQSSLLALCLRIAPDRAQSTRVGIELCARQVP